jgi:hypothetical protein
MRSGWPASGGSIRPEARVGSPTPGTSRRLTANRRPRVATPTTSLASAGAPNESELRHSTRVQVLVTPGLRADLTAVGQGLHSQPTGSTVTVSP